MSDAASATTVIAPPAPPGVDERRLQSRLAAHGVVTIQWVDQDDKIHSVTTKLRDESKDGLGVFCDRPIEPGRVVWIADEEDVQQKAVVRYSRPRFGRWKIGLYVVKDEKRRVDRYPVSGPGRITWGFLAADTFDADVRVVNVSPVGAAVLSPISIPPDARARLFGDQLDCIGTVRHSTPQGDGFLIGLHFSAQPLDTRPEARQKPYFPQPENR